LSMADDRPSHKVVTKINHRKNTSQHSARRAIASENTGGRNDSTVRQKPLPHAAHPRLSSPKEIMRLHDPSLFLDQVAPLRQLSLHFGRERLRRVADNFGPLQIGSPHDFRCVHRAFGLGV
jgi:hypothetical protein